MQGWGGELGRYKDTDEGNAFLLSLEGISIKTVRQLISKLISKGFDRTKPERMDEQEVLVIKSACAGQMEIVAQLKERTSSITKDLHGLTEAMQVCVKELRTQLENALQLLEPAARSNQKPLDNSVFEQGRVARKRPHTAVEPRNRIDEKAQRKLFESVDVDKSGCIDFEEFAAMSCNAGINRPQLKAVFDSLDVRGNGATCFVSACLCTPTIIEDTWTSSSD